MIHVRKTITIIGDKECGKTSLLEVFHRRIFQDNYSPTTILPYSTRFTYNGKRIEFLLRDIGGDDVNHNFRQLSYNDTDVIFMCFSIGSPSSFERIRNKWAQEAKYSCPRAPVYLIGAKKDLRDNSINSCQIKKCIEVSEKIKAFAYFECSAKYCEGVDAIFQSVAREFLPENKTMSSCGLF